MSYVATKLVTTDGKVSFHLLGSFSTLKLAAAAALEEYKNYNKNASFINLEMVEEWLSTRGEYSFRQDRKNRLQLDISQTEEDTVLPAERQVVYTLSAAEDEKNISVSQALCPDGISQASR